MTMRAIEATIAQDLATSENATREALARQGFGVLTEIDVAATLRHKLGVERAPLKILGACNPEFAHRALEIDPSVALVLPCNVVLEAVDTGTSVRVVDPRELMDDPRFDALAEEAAARLQAAVDELDRPDSSESLDSP
jgi:uncharacterized protein (DUF302 family)